MEMPEEQVDASASTDATVSAPDADCDADKRRLRGMLIRGVALGAIFGLVYLLMRGGGRESGASPSTERKPHPPRSRNGGKRSTPARGAKGKLKKVTLEDGETLGDIITRYVGDYTEANVDLVRQMNADVISDLDLLHPGDVLTVPDNRTPPSEPPTDGRIRREARGVPMPPLAGTAGAKTASASAWAKDDDEEDEGTRVWERAPGGKAKPPVGAKDRKARLSRGDDDPTI